MDATLRERLALVEEALMESTVKISDVLEICEPPQKNYEAGPSTLHIEVL